jgi:hypothetical protein
VAGTFAADGQVSNATIVSQYALAGGWQLRRYGTSDDMELVARSAPTTDSAVANGLWDAVADGAPHCLTVVWDVNTLDGARAYLDGAEWTDWVDQDMSSISDLGPSVSTPFYAFAAGGAFNRAAGGISRLRVTHNASKSLANHQLICGTIWQAPSEGSTEIASGDVSYTHTGGARCYQTGASSAVCAPGGVLAYAKYGSLGSTDTGWANEPSCINRLLYNTAIAANWNVASGSATDGKVGPDGSAAATEFAYTSGLNNTRYTLSGYSVSTALDLRMWIRCVTYTDGPRLKNRLAGTNGDWEVDCSQLNGTSWTYIDASHTAVTVVESFASNASGQVQFGFQSSNLGTVTYQVWAPTLTEEAGCYSTVPTGSSAVDTGSPTWALDNDPANYYSGVDGRIDMTGYWIAGGGLDIDNTGDDNGRSYIDGDHWVLNNSAASIVSQINLVTSGEHDVNLLWDSAAAVYLTHFTAGYLDGTPQTYDTDPTSSWTPATPNTISLTPTGTSLIMQTLRIYDAAETP